MKNLFCVLFLTTCLFLNGFAQSGVTLTEKQVVMPTYSVAPPDKNPYFFRGEAYQGASRHYYPLKLNDQYYPHTRTMQGLKTLLLENEYIELGITPDIGGKLWYATDKTNNYHFLYKNDVVRPSNIGMTGAWVSGGIEWCVGHHHRSSTYLPLDYTTTENPDGSKTVWVAEYELRHGMRWTIGVTMFPGKSYFKTEGRIHNSSPFAHSFLFWANVAAHTNVNYQAIFPPSAQAVMDHSKVAFTEWPVSTTNYGRREYNGADISWWKNVPGSASFFVYDLKEDFMGGYDHGKHACTVHVGDHNIVKGAKLWEWGSGPAGQATEALLTETAGPYVELMVGAYSDNQPDYSWIRPYEVKVWEQYWYPVRNIGGFKYANLHGAVNLEEKNEKNRYGVFLGYYATEKLENAKVILKNKDNTIFEKTISISPDRPFTETISMGGAYAMTDLHTQLLNSAGDVLIEYQPIVQPSIELPENWPGYAEVDKLETVEELYLEGKRIELFYAPRYDPMDYYHAALSKDPGDIRTNTAIGNIHLRNGDYIAARRHLATAIKRLTNNYTRPSTCEALYLQGLTLRRLGLLAEAEDTLYRATWDYACHSAAFYQLAELSCAKNDFRKALQQINESLWTNGRNNSAVALKASVQRRMRDFNGALATLAPIAADDPLDFRIRNEYYLIAKESGDTQKANSILASLNKEMRDFDENYLPLAIGYLNNGLLDEAEEILKRFKGNNPFFNYFLGYIADKRGNSNQASNYFKTAAGQSIDYIFPHRLEEIDALNVALKYNPTDANACYFLGNILYMKQPDAAMQKWEEATKLNPNLSTAYRNLGWGYYYHHNDIPKAIAQYEKALSLNKNEAIYYSELSDLYVRNNASIETRARLFEGSDIAVVRQRDDAYMSLIEILTLSNQAEKAVELLEGIALGYREGASRSRNVRINANIMLGKQYFDRQDFQNALKYFSAARIDREEAGNTILGDREAQVDYYIGIANEALRNRSAATAAFRRSVQETPQTVTVMSFYQGLSYDKLGNKEQAKKIFESLIATADRQLQASESSEVGVIFGRGEASGERLSRLHTMRGLGYKGLGDVQKAKEDLNKALELSPSNLWALAESL